MTTEVRVERQGSGWVVVLVRDDGAATRVGAQYRDRRRAELAAAQFRDAI